MKYARKYTSDTRGFPILSVAVSMQRLLKESTRSGRDPYKDHRSTLPVAEENRGMQPNSRYLQRDLLKDQQQGFTQGNKLTAGILMYSVWSATYDGIGFTTVTKPLKRGAQSAALEDRIMTGRDQDTWQSVWEVAEFTVCT